MRAIVNFSTKQYLKGQERLKESLKNSGADIFCFTESDIVCPKHYDNPYAFKVCSMDRLRNYDQVLWLDASVWAVKDMSPVFEWISQNGFFVEDSGHKVGKWCNDRCLKYYNITRDQAMSMRMISSGFVGIDFTSDRGREIFARWKNAMKAGVFKGSWANHRHDQTALSIIVQQMGLDDLISECGQFFAYIGEVFEKPKETAVCHLQGIV